MAQLTDQGEAHIYEFVNSEIEKTRARVTSMGDVVIKSNDVASIPYALLKVIDYCRGKEMCGELTPTLEVIYAACGRAQQIMRDSIQPED